MESAKIRWRRWMLGGVVIAVIAPGIGRAQEDERVVVAGCPISIALPYEGNSRPRFLPCEEGFVAVELASCPAASIGIDGTVPPPAPCQPIEIEVAPGVTLPIETKDVLVSLSLDAEEETLLAVLSEIESHGARVAGLLSELGLAQVRADDLATIPSLIDELRLMDGVRYVGPVRLAGTQQCIDEPRLSNCGTQPGDPGWDPAQLRQATKVIDSPEGIDGITVIVLDDFADKGEDPQHGDEVLAVLLDSAGTDKDGQDVLRPGENLIRIDLPVVPGTERGLDVLSGFQELERTLKDLGPEERIVVNYSIGDACEYDENTGRLIAPRSCRHLHGTGDQQMDAFVDKLNKKYEDRILWVHAGGNDPVIVPPEYANPDPSVVKVVGIDTVGTYYGEDYPTRFRISTEYAGKGVAAAPACNVMSRRLPGRFTGNSYAAPQVAAAAAGAWARHRDLPATAVGEALVSLPRPGGDVPVLNGQELLNRLGQISDQGGHPDVPDAEAGECTAIELTPKISRLFVGDTARLSVQPPDQLSCLNFVVDPPDTVEWSPNDQLADRLLGRFGTLDVTAMRPGKATILFEHKHRICSGSATVIVPSETYTGTFHSTHRKTTRNKPHCSPRTSSRQRTRNGDMELVLTTGSMLTPGRVAGQLHITPRHTTTTGRIEMLCGGCVTGHDSSCHPIQSTYGDGDGDLPRTVRFVGGVENLNGELHVELLLSLEEGRSPLSGRVSVAEVSPTANEVRLDFSWERKLENPSYYREDVAQGGYDWADHILEQDNASIDLVRQYSSTFPSRIP